MINCNQPAKPKFKGFTLIEMMVSVSIFAIVALITSGALVTASNVNRKAQAIKLAMDNISFAMDSMVLNFREAADFNCVASNITTGAENGIISPGTPATSGLFTSTSNTGANNCEGIYGGAGIFFTQRRCVSGAICPDGNRIFYRRHQHAGTNSYGSIQIAWRSQTNDITDFADITSPEVDINDLRFYAIDAVSAPPKQPWILMVVGGRVVGKTDTSFHLQTMVIPNR